jgi:hypothetical protein
VGAAGVVAAGAEVDGVEAAGVVAAGVEVAWEAAAGAAKAVDGAKTAAATDGSWTGACVRTDAGVAETAAATAEEQTFFLTA